MSIHITLQQIDPTPPPASGIAAPPAGYGLFVARPWGDGIMVAEAGLSTSAEYFNTSNFQVIPVLVPQTATFSATAGNHSYYSKAKGDFDAIWKLQPADGRTQEAMFNPIIQAGNYIKTWWTNSVNGWDAVDEWVAGSQCWGGQMFAATLQTFPITTSLPNKPKATYLFRKIYPFRREHFALSFETHPWLINKYTVAFRKPKENTYSETFNGLERFIPFQCLDPRDFKFAGSKVPEYFIPERWCVPFSNYMQEA